MSVKYYNIYKDRIETVIAETIYVSDNFITIILPSGAVILSEPKHILKIQCI